MRSIALAVLLSSMLAACVSFNSEPERPAWIDNPGEGAVGSCTTHAYGRYAQEQLAISRARERLAERYGVEISAVQTTSETVKNDRAYVTSDRQVFQQVRNQTVRAHVRAMWHDKVRDEIWVWVYPVAQ